MGVTDDHMDVLQNIEAIVAQVYRENREMTNYDVEHVYEALISLYRAEERGRQPRAWNPTALEQELFDAVKPVCDWRLGKSTLEAEDDGKPVSPPEPIDLGTMVRCLRRLKKSVENWTDMGGRQGYLNFVSQFV